MNGKSMEYLAWEALEQKTMRSMGKIEDILGREMLTNEEWDKWDAKWSELRHRRDYARQKQTAFEPVPEEPV